uniref:Uncharacterized protein n=1 Tax=Oncorhynchus tshawytscha TaxID=74940 RepID=A0A8C8H2N9_ONCTS
MLLEFVLGVLGNDLALWIFCFHLKPWKSITVFLLNIKPCRMFLFMLAMNRGESVVFFLMAVTLDRYMRVDHPHHPFNSMIQSWKLQKAARMHQVHLCLGISRFCVLPSNITRLLIWMKNTGTASTDRMNMLDPVVYYFLRPCFKRIYEKVLRFSLRQNRVGMSNAVVNKSQGSQCLSEVRKCLVIRHLFTETLHKPKEITARGTKLLP